MKRESRFASPKGRREEYPGGGSGEFDGWSLAGESSGGVDEFAGEGGPALDKMLIGFFGSNLLEVGLGPFNLGFFSRSGAGENVDGRGVPGGVGFGKIVAVSLGEGLFDAEIDSGDEFEVVLGACKNLNGWKHGGGYGGGVGAIDSEFPETGADFARGFEILPKVKADFVLRFPEPDGGKPAAEHSGGVCFPSLEMLELGDAFFGVGKVHGKSVFQTMEKILGCELEMLVGK